MLLEFKPTGNYFRVVPIQGITLKISEESKVRIIPSLSAKVHSGLSNVYDVCKPVFCFFLLICKEFTLQYTNYACVPDGRFQEDLKEVQGGLLSHWSPVHVCVHYIVKSTPKDDSILIFLHFFLFNVHILNVLLLLIYILLPYFTSKLSKAARISCFFSFYN